MALPTTDTLSLLNKLYGGTGKSKTYQAGSDSPGQKQNNVGNISAALKSVLDSQQSSIDATGSPGSPLQPQDFAMPSGGPPPWNGFADVNPQTTPGAMGTPYGVAPQSTATALPGMPPAAPGAPMSGSDITQAVSGQATPATAPAATPGAGNSILGSILSRSAQKPLTSVPQYDPNQGMHQAQHQAGAHAAILGLLGALGIINPITMSQIAGPAINMPFEQMTTDNAARHAAAQKAYEDETDRMYRSGEIQNTHEGNVLGYIGPLTKAVIEGDYGTAQRIIGAIPELAKVIDPASLQKIYGGAMGTIGQQVGGNGPTFAPSANVTADTNKAAAETGKLTAETAQIPADATSKRGLETAQGAQASATAAKIGAETPTIGPVAQSENLLRDRQGRAAMLNASTNYNKLTLDQQKAVLDDPAMASFITRLDVIDEQLTAANAQMKAIRTATIAGKFGSQEPIPDAQKNSILAGIDANVKGLLAEKAAIRQLISDRNSARVSVIQPSTAAGSAVTTQGKSNAPSGLQLPGLGNNARTQLNPADKFSEAQLRALARKRGLIK